MVNVTALNTGSTSIAVIWAPPTGRIPGIVRGHRIFFTKYGDIIKETIYRTVDNENITNYVVREMALMNETIFDPGLTTFNITGLQRYTKYCLWVTVFTVADSPNSHAVCLYTDEDGELSSIALRILTAHNFTRD